MFHAITLLRHANSPILSVSFQDMTKISQSLLDKNIFWVLLYYIVWNLAHDFLKIQNLFYFKVGSQTTSE